MDIVVGITVIALVLLRIYGVWLKATEDVRPLPPNPRVTAIRKYRPNASLQLVVDRDRIEVPGATSLDLSSPGRVVEAWLIDSEFVVVLFEPTGLNSNLWGYSRGGRHLWVAERPTDGGQVDAAGDSVLVFGGYVRWESDDDHHFFWTAHSQKVAINLRTGEVFDFRGRSDLDPASNG